MDSKLICTVMYDHIYDVHNHTSPYGDIRTLLSQPVVFRQLQSNKQENKPFKTSWVSRIGQVHVPCLFVTDFTLSLPESLSCTNSLDSWMWSVSMKV